MFTPVRYEDNRIALHLSLSLSLSFRCVGAPRCRFDGDRGHAAAGCGRRESAAGSERRQESTVRRTDRENAHGPTHHLQTFDNRDNRIIGYVVAGCTFFLFVVWLFDKKS